MPGNKNWSKDEIEILRAHLEELTSNQIQARFLPNRTVKAVRRMSAKLKTPEQKTTGSARPEWTKADLEYLRDNFASMDYPELAEHLGRSEKAVHTKVDQLRLTRKLLKPGPGGAQTPWTPEELRALERHAGELTVAALQRKYLPDRTRAAVRAQLRRKGLAKPAPRRWTPGELKIVRDNMDRPLSEWLDLLPGRSELAVHNRVSSMRLNDKLK